MFVSKLDSYHEIVINLSSIILQWSNTFALLYVCSKCKATLKVTCPSVIDSHAKYPFLLSSPGATQPFYLSTDHFLDRWKSKEKGISIISNDPIIRTPANRQGNPK